MKRIIFSTDNDTIERWQKRDPQATDVVYDISELQERLQNDPEQIVLVDYDSVAQEFNKLLTAGALPVYSIVLERAPAIATGKMLLLRGVKAYGNSSMLPIHYKKMIDTVEKGDIWSYPELTAALVKKKNTPNLNDEARQLVENRLSPKEQEVLQLLLEGLTNDAIAEKLGITPRTVKAHISSIFEKLHVNDRLSLALLLLS